MGDVINFRQARKKHDRAAKERTAEENRTRFGRTKGEKAAEDQRRDAEIRHIDGHRLGDAGPDGEDDKAG
ncbi:hypothetical protein GGD81_004456 [Rhodobium orientis]|uniref:DUF4169 domain-containing protein n=2 Tax=Rhodobium TaxID=34016 RepID=A0A327JHQ4_9HYPH|nr:MULTISPECIES: DUF4169 family protein [Rhodobium]MBB4305380.1 hypothetical protein [Rhodobium orientis]MBK5950086.1 hypothetical protein [Rhodobium orientis]MCW2307004.1 hypothetical protein [Rhodobium gokarnense]RAI25246.1 hypothetical protein CH339_19055 [Rhodobium orientis]